MRKTTIFLPADEYRTLQQLARRQGRAAAELVREAVVEYARRQGAPRLPRSLGMGESNVGDLGERAEELLPGFGE